ncbi:MAG: hypothetical protein ACK559_39855, partial [bacterium]
SCPCFSTSSMRRSFAGRFFFAAVGGAGVTGAGRSVPSSSPSPCWCAASPSSSGSSSGGPTSPT